MNGLILVAHPDDEILFAGGLMLAHPETTWTIVCMTHDFDHERGQHFGVASHCLRDRGVSVSPYMLGMRDPARWLNTTEYVIWRKRLWRWMTDHQYTPDVVVTHNRLGEYGHPHHMSTHSIAREVFTCPVWSFYCEAPSGVGAQERLEHTYSIDLGKGLRVPKLAVMKTAYLDELRGLTNNQPDLIEWVFGDRETFTSDRGWPL